MTNNREARKTISAIVEKLKVAYQPEKILLFGSFAYGRLERGDQFLQEIVSRGEVLYAK